MVHTSVAAVGSLARDEVRFVLDSVEHLSHDDGSWALNCTARGFELRCTATPPASPTRVAGLSGMGCAGDARELLIRCGRVVLDLRVAVRALGVHPTVHLLPDVEDPDLIAVVQPQGHGVPTPDDLALLEAIPLLRDQGQRAVDHQQVPAATMTRLRQSAKIEQAWLATLTDEQVRNLSTDGAPSAGPHDPQTGVTAVIGSLRDLPTARLQAGQALERVVLTAMAADVHTAVLAAVVSSEEGRMRVRDVIGGGLWPQSVIRLGGSPQAPSPS